MQSQDRLHALDAVRAFALLLGIVLHATMSFLPALAAAGWPIVDNSPSDTLGIAFSVIHIFRMTTFFVMAGFFARLVLYRRGTQGFVKDRMKRILIPLVVSWPVVIALISGVMVWALLKAGKPLVAPPQNTSVLLPFPWTHLWFLYVLVLLYVFLLGARWLANVALDKQGTLRTQIDRVVAATISVPVAPLLLALPVAAGLYFSRTWVYWGGIPTPDNSIIPNLAAAVGYATAITFGWFLHRQAQLLNSLQRYWVLYFGAALALTVICFSIGGTPSTVTAIKLDAAARAVYAGLYGAAIWTWTFAVIGAANRFLSGESTVRRYLADSSYWLYILHLPLVFALQVWVSAWSMHWSLKFSFIVAVTVGLLLLSYHYFVRPTYIGEVLNGRRYPRTTPKSIVSASTTNDRLQDNRSQDSGAVLASLRDAHKKYDAIAALSGLDLDIRRGELVSVLGPNGAGKSTAIALLLGLQQPTSGTVSLFGSSPHDLQARRRIGVMMQQVELAPELRVREHIELTASYYPNPYSVEEVVALTRIGDIAERRYRQLSGGQKRQAQFAMAVCGRPSLLFLDEPTVGLDVQARETMWRTIRQLIANGCAIVLTTHYLEEAEALADRVVVMNKGRVIASGSVAELRSFVSRRHVSCVSQIPIERIHTWSEVSAVGSHQGRVSITTSQAELVVRRLLAEDDQLSELEVRRAGLSDVFTELTQEGA